MFLIPFVTVSVLCLIAAFVLPRKYESTTTILVQRDEVLNPLVSFTMAVAMASDDRLQALNEIVYAEPTIGLLIDSLRMGDGVRVGRQELVKRIRGEITTQLRGPDSFTLTFTDTRPARAQAAVKMLADRFMQMQVQVANRRNEAAVEFFEKKVDDLRQTVEANQKSLIGTMSSQIREMPTQSRELYSRMEDADKQIGDLDGRISVDQQALTVLRGFPAALHTDEGRKQLFDLERQQIPFAAELGSALTRYTDAQGKYTNLFPEVQKLEKQVLDVISRMRSSAEADLARLQTDRWKLERDRSQDLDDIQRSSTTQKLNEAQEADYNLYAKLYDDMKIKLEQARITRDLGKTGAQRYVIIDPPQVPTDPAKPNRPLIAGGGIAIGLILGILCAGTAELLDTRVKTFTDVRVYGLPIIAYIPDGQPGGRA